MEQQYVSQAPVNVYQTLNDMNRNASTSNANTRAHRQSDAWETVRSKSPDAASFLQDADKFPMYATCKYT